MGITPASSKASMVGRSKIFLGFGLATIRRQPRPESSANNQPEDLASFLASASLKNLYGLFPRSHYKARSPNSRGQLHRPSVPLILQDVYFCIGHLFDGAVVDGDRKLESPDWKPDKGKTIELGKIFWGDDLISVDRKACEVGGEEIPDYLEAIAAQRNFVN